MSKDKRNIFQRAIVYAKYRTSIFMWSFGAFLPDRLYLQIQYYLQIGKRLNLKKPRTFTEKIQWLKLYDRRPEYSDMVDKYKAKYYVENIIGKEYVIPTLGIWDRFDDIDFNTLPNQFVLKTTQAGGGMGVIVCRDKDKLDIFSAKKKLEYALGFNNYKVQREWPYKNIVPRIIAEQYMEDEDSKNNELRDYKFFCCDGSVKFFKVDFDRFIAHKANYYDRDLNLLPFWEKSFGKDFTKENLIPENVKEMISIAEKLAKGIPFVRIDLYDIAGKIYFGEITFYPSAGFGLLAPDEWNEKVGDMINLPINR